MSENYVECLVKGRGPRIMIVLRLVLYLMVAVFLYLALAGFGIIGTILAILSGVAGFYLGQYGEIEYEYLYLDKELTVDKVIAQSKRKRVASYTMDKVEIMAPIHSYRLDQYGKANRSKVLDYSIGYAEQPDERYVIYYEGDVKLLLSPSEELIRVMKNANPRKVFSD